MRCTAIFTAAAGFLLVAPIATAQQPARPPIRPLGAVTAKSSESFGTIGAIRSLPRGRLLVNDMRGRRVVMLDASLAPVAVVADTTSATGNAYASRFAGIVAYRGDSTLFIDPQSLSMLVIDPAGKIARVMSIPRSQDAMALTGGVLGGAAFDGRSGIVYRGSGAMQFRRSGGPGATAGPPVPQEQPDTASVVRIDLATRKLDTVAFVKIPKFNMQMTTNDKGEISITREINPLPTVDEWAMLPDGSIAVVRGRDYHVDFIRPDGTRSSSPKIPFDWQRMTDEDKVAFIDSVKAARARLLAADSAAASGAESVRLQQGQRAEGTAPGGGAGRGDAAAAAAGTTVMSMRVGGPGGTVTTSSGPGNVEFVSPDELPDYRPPFFAGALRVDGEGNLWIRTTAMPTEQGASVYDVVNTKGELVDRVQVPAGRTITGFGTDGAVYLTSRVGAETVVERANVR